MALFLELYLPVVHPSFASMLWWLLSNSNLFAFVGMAKHSVSLPEYLTFLQESRYQPSPTVRAVLLISNLHFTIESLYLLNPPLFSLPFLFSLLHPLLWCPAGLSFQQRLPVLLSSPSLCTWAPKTIYFLSWSWVPRTTHPSEERAMWRRSITLLQLRHKFLAWFPAWHSDEPNSSQYTDKQEKWIAPVQ